MKDIKQKLSKLNNREKISAYGIIFLFLWISWSTLRVIQSNYALQKKVDDIKQDILDLQLENDRLAFSNQFYQTDEYLELAVRQELNKILPDEKLFVGEKYDDQFDNDLAVENGDSSNSAGDNVREWFKLLFGLSV